MNEKSYRFYLLHFDSMFLEASENTVELIRYLLVPFAQFVSGCNTLAQKIGITCKQHSFICLRSVCLIPGIEKHGVGEKAENCPH